MIHLHLAFKAQCVWCLWDLPLRNCETLPVRFLFMNPTRASAIYILSLHMYDWEGINNMSSETSEHPPAPCAQLWVLFCSVWLVMNVLCQWSRMMEGSHPSTGLENITNDSVKWVLYLMDLSWNIFIHNVYTLLLEKHFLDISTKEGLLYLEKSVCVSIHLSGSYFT